MAGRSVGSVTAPGPPALGRGLVVSDGGPVLAPWADAPVVVIDDEVVRSPGTVVEQLHAAWAERRPVVVDLRVDPVTFRRPVEHHDLPWELSPSFELWHDRLHFLVWNNNYDARTGTPIWWWGRKAARIGGQAADELPDDMPVAGDLLLPDGQPAWVDGGPPDDVDPGLIGPAVLIRSDSIEAGHLTPMPTWVPPAAELAADQLAAVSHRGGPARIIAPAGSGKTRVLTERLRHLLADRGHEVDGVLAVAYNRKAQEEMATRTQGLGARIQTLNALGYELIGRHVGRRPQLIDEREVRRRLEPHLPKLQRRLNTDPMAPYLEGLSIIRLGLRDPDEVEAELDGADGLAAAVGPYREGLRRDGVLDFDEQIVHAIELLLADGRFRRAQQSRHRHLLVDEFQDLTPAHVLLIRLLAAPTFDVFGVGDDDQCIYGHGGASPQFLLRFADLFPGAHEHALEVNYRCPPAVVDAARHLLAYNDERVDKTITAARPDDGPDTLRVVEHPPQEGARRVVEAVQAAIEAAGDAGQVAVLTRTNSLLLAPHVALHGAGVPIASVLRRDVLDRVGLRAALAWLRVGTDPGNVSGADLQEIRRRPSRGFPSWIDKWLKRCRSSHEVAKAAERIDDERVASKLADLAADIDQLHAVAGSGTTRQVLQAIRDDVGLGGAMELLDGRPGAEGSSHLDDLDALLQVADLQPDPDLFEAWLRRALDGPRAGDDPTAGAVAGVTLSTVHRVKGREWPHVVVFGADAGIFPHRLAEDVEEERRVFHVAITRGIEQVTVLADDDRPSPFLGELDGSAPRRPKGAGRRPTAGAAPAGGRAGRQNVLAGTAGGGRSSPASELEGEDLVLFEQLRQWRSEVARRQGGPAFTIFNDATLSEIARRRPADLRALRAIKGVGPSKLDSYGDDVVEIVLRFA